ncbi:MAG: OmpA family protein [Planctomycetes bacterium]|nr:OmpA family protein [Planctomycetota bacterium]
MTSVRYIAAVVGCAALMLSAVGCGPDARDLQIQSLQERRDALERANADLRALLAAARDDADESRVRALELEQMLADAERLLADERGKVRETGRWTEVGVFAWVTLGTDILFDSGQATLKPAGLATLAEIARELQSQYADRFIWVIGHTDSDPIKVTKNLWKDNLHLSQGRARAVALELMKHGLDGRDIVAGGQGERSPRASNDTKEGRTQNRRVQIWAVPRPPTDTAPMAQPADLEKG